MHTVHDLIRRRSRDCAVVVFDLDGVIREFGPATSEQVAASLGMAPREFLEIAFATDLVEPVVTGQRSFAEWCALIRDALEARGATAATAAAAVERWVADRGAPVPETLEVVDDLAAAGTPVFLFTNGTDNIPAELGQIGLGHLVDVVINSAVLGVRKPRLEAYAAAHATLQAHLGAGLAPSQVLFVDDRLENAEGAIRFGWQAVHFDVGVRTDV